MLAVSMPNFATSSALVETATKCLAMAFSSPLRPASSQARAVCALVIVSNVVKVLEADDEQGLGGIEIVHRLGEIGAIDVRDEAERHGPLAVMLAALRRP